MQETRKRILSTKEMKPYDPINNNYLSSIYTYTVRLINLGKFISNVYSECIFIIILVDQY